MNKLLLDRIVKWQDETFGKATPMSKLYHLQEELVELMTELSPTFPDETIDNEKVMDEYADCFLLLYGSANKFGLDWDQINLAISRKMDKNEKREWGEPDENGVVRHKK